MDITVIEKKHFKCIDFEHGHLVLLVIVVLLLAVVIVVLVVVYPI